MKKNIELPALTSVYSEQIILGIKSFMNNATVDDLKNTYLTIPFNDKKTHSLEIYFYNEDEDYVKINPLKARQFVYICLVEGSENKPVNILHYEDKIPCPACLDFVDISYLKMIIESFKITLPLLNKKYEEASKKYSDLWIAWDTILTINYEVSEENE